MRSIRRTTQFKKDVKRAKKRGKDLVKLKRLIETLMRGMPLAEKYRDHALGGTYQGTRDCHIEPDWLLLYELTEEDLVLIRTGTHSDLFK